jgi:hypothetical protein
VDDLADCLDRVLAIFSGNAWYDDAALPSVTDAAVTALVEKFMTATASQREQLSATIPMKFRAYFMSFAVRMATLGVRERSEIRLLHGLVALAIENFQVDWREDLMTLAPLNDAAIRVGADPVALFDKAASFASAPAAQQLRAFVRRHPDLKDIKVMGFSARDAPEGFAYVFGWPKLPPKT